jgi:tRNA(Ile)-lysidine synthase
MCLLTTLERFLRHDAGVATGDGIVVAFSGGADSTALLWGLSRLQPRLGLRLIAAHLDHGLDADSVRRRDLAASTAARLGVKWVEDRLRGSELALPNGLEAAARQERYDFLEAVRRRYGYRWLATAHHRDDQIETVLLRLAFGSGPLGLSSIPGVRGPVMRPLLDSDRRQIERALERAGLPWTEDPTNATLERPRNRVRHHLRPALERRDPALPEALLAVAAAASSARDHLRARLERELGPECTDAEVSVSVERFARLPRELRRPALDLLHERAGRPYPAPGAAVRELERQLCAGLGIGCDCGGGWRWDARAGRLVLHRLRNETPDFTYTLKLPGELEIDELQLRIRVRACEVRPWMFRASSHRAALSLPLQDGDEVTIRNRRSGDTVRPFGWQRNCRLKDLLINRRVPRHRRSRIPLLCCESDIAWVPGVTTHDRYRIDSQTRVWVAEIFRSGALR